MQQNGKIERMAIIGTGIGGLAMSACLKHFNTGVKEVVVFDPHNDILEYNKGGALGLSGGAVILDKIGALDALKQYAQNIDHISFNYKDHVLFDFDKEDIKKSMPVSLVKGNGEEQLLTYTCRWSMLRKVLFDHSLLPSMKKASVTQPTMTTTTQESKEIIPESQNEDLDAIKIKYQMGRRFMSLQEDTASGKVTLFFEGGIRAEGFDLVIGADGVKSTVRNHTKYPHETILAAIPFGWLFGDIRGPQYTGMHVTQCMTPLRKDVPEDTEKTQNVSTMSVDELAARMGHAVPPYSTTADGGSSGKGKESGGGSSGRIARARSHSISLELTHNTVYDTIVSQFSNRFARYIGNACDLLVLTLGEAETTHYALVAIYAHPGKYSYSSSWRDTVTNKEQIVQLHQRLDNAGFQDFHMNFHAFLEAAKLPGGNIFDVAVYDFLIPLRSWSSSSGRVLLLGDSAHAMSPFLGQGANQALQDAFCLCNLIYKHNHPQHVNSPLWEDLHRPTMQSMLVAIVLGMQEVLKFLLGFGGVKHSLFPSTSMQRLARDYECTRKFHCFLITVGSRGLGMVESLGTTIGLWLKVLILGGLGRTGILKYFFLSPMKPVV